MIQVMEELVQLVPLVKAAFLREDFVILREELRRHPKHPSNAKLEFVMTIKASWIDDNYRKRDEILIQSIVANLCSRLPASPSVW